MMRRDPRSQRGLQAGSGVPQEPREGQVVTVGKGKLCSVGAELQLESSLNRHSLVKSRVGER